MGMITEFKEFAMRGNVIDLAVGVVIGAAFGKIVTSLVDDVVMPVIGKLDRRRQFHRAGDRAEAGTVSVPTARKTAAAVLLNYGAFIQTHHRLHS